MASGRRLDRPTMPRHKRTPCLEVTLEKPPDSATDLVARIVLLERRYRRLQAFVGLLVLPVLAAVGIGATQHTPQVLHAERLVLRSADSASYADIELAGRDQLRFRVFGNVRRAAPPPNGAPVSPSLSAGLELVAGQTPALVLTTGEGREVIRLAPGVRPVER